MEPKNQSALEQAMAEIRDTIPPVCWSFYNKCCEEGFHPSEAILLTSEFMKAILSISAVDPSPPNSSQPPPGTDKW